MKTKHEARCFILSYEYSIECTLILLSKACVMQVKLAFKAPIHLVIDRRKFFKNIKK